MASYRLLFGDTVLDGFPAPEQTEPIVTGLRNAWAAGEGTIGSVTVQVDRGRGWETHEHVDFATETSDV